MLTLVRPFGFLDGGLLNNRKECTCSPHSRATEDYNKNGNVYKYCSQIHVTLNCLNNLGNNKNCSLNLATSTLQTGTVWQFKYYNCTEILKRKPSDFKSTVSSKDTRHGKDGDKNNIPGPKRDDKCVYRRKFVDTVHCGLFGDPHLKTFSNRRQTCVVKGAWPMLNNRYLAVQVTNVLIERNNPVATATSKVSFIVIYFESYFRSFLSYNNITISNIKMSNSCYISRFSSDLARGNNIQKCWQATCLTMDFLLGFPR